jgi:hypothetical protein
MQCVNCGHENLEKALICYWCGLVPSTGEPPYQALATSGVSFEGESLVPGVTMPPPIEVPPPMPVPEISIGLPDIDAINLTMPELPPLEIAPPPDIPSLDHFTKVQRRRVRHNPAVYRAPAPPKATRPVLPGLGRILVFVGGLGLLILLGTALVGTVGAVSFGSVFCLTGLLGLAFVVWIGLLLARTGRRVVTATGAAYERLEVLGRALREVAPGRVQDLPVNLPAQLGVLDLPVAYSELGYLAQQGGEPSMDRVVDLLTGAIASLIGRDDVVLAHRTYPVQTRGLLAPSASTQVSQPVLTRRRTYVGPGELETQIAQTLRTDRPMTVGELMDTMFGTDRRQRVQRFLTWLDHTLSENPPDLEALTSPDAALVELERFRTALRRADPELYEMLEGEIRRGLGAVAQRPLPSSLLDLARYAQTANRSGASGQKSGTGRRG